MSLGDTITLSLVQMNSGPDRDANIARAAAYRPAVEIAERPDLVVIPEFFNHFYVFNERDHEHLKRAEPTGPSITAMRAKAAEHRIHLRDAYEEESAGLYYDTAFVIDPKGAIVGKYRKVMPGLYLSLERFPLRLTLFGLPGGLVEDRLIATTRSFPSTRAAQQSMAPS